MSNANDWPDTDEMMRKRGYVSPEKVARAIGKTPAAIRALVHEDRLRYVRVGDGPKAPIYIEWRSVVDHVGPEAAEVLGLSAKPAAV